MNDKTAVAIRRYEKYTGLEVTGRSSEKLLNSLRVPCQIEFKNDFYTGESSTQPRFACRAPRPAAPGVAELMLAPANPAELGGAACGRGRCRPAPVTPTRHSEIPLRFDGIYHANDSGKPRFLRFRPDGTMLMTTSPETAYEAACALSTATAAKSGLTPRPYKVNGTKVHFDVQIFGREPRLRAMTGTIGPDSMALGYDDEIALFVTSSTFAFYPDPR
jgi:hypothetical protein